MALGDFDMLRENEVVDYFIWPHVSVLEEGWVCHKDVYDIYYDEYLYVADDAMSLDEFSRDAKEYFAWLDTRLNHVPQTGYFYSEPYSF